MEKPSAGKRGARDLATAPGHAFVEGNVQLWPDIVNAEKTAVVVKPVLRQAPGAGPENSRRMERVRFGAHGTQRHFN
jgi:hypothetical protein